MPSRQAFQEPVLEHGAEVQGTWLWINWCFLSRGASLFVCIQPRQIVHEGENRCTVRDGVRDNDAKMAEVVLLSFLIRVPYERHLERRHEASAQALYLALKPVPWALDLEEDTIGAARWCTPTRPAGGHCRRNRGHDALQCRAPRLLPQQLHNRGTLDEVILCVAAVLDSRPERMLPAQEPRDGFAKSRKLQRAGALEQPRQAIVPTKCPQTERAAGPTA